MHVLWIPTCAYEQRQAEGNVLNLYLVGAHSLQLPILTRVMTDQ